MSTSVQPSDPWGGSCTGCGAFLAADQRYCLACGTRRDGARLPFREALTSSPAPTVVPATAHALPPVGAQAYGPTGASPTLLTTLAALACVLLAFGVGVVVGDDGDGGAPQQAVAPVAAQAVAPSAATTTDEAAASAADEAKAKAKAKAAAAKADAEAESATPAKPKPIPKKLAETSKKAIEGLESAKTPKDYSEQSSKLPDVVVTGGGK